MEALIASREAHKSRKQIEVLSARTLVASLMPQQELRVFHNACLKLCLLMKGKFKIVVERIRI